MTDPMTREQFERFDRFSKGGSGYAEKRLVATVRSLYETIDMLYFRIEDYEDGLAVHAAGCIREDCG